jgi:hypothetical protein
MIIAQQSSPILGHADIWQVLVEYEHALKDALLLTGFRLEWQAGFMQEWATGQVLPVEVVLFADGGRRVLDRTAETVGRRCRYERYFANSVVLHREDIVQVRAKFPSAVGHAHVVLF